MLDVTGANGHIYVGARIVDGTETNPTVTWTGVTTGTSGDSSLAIIHSVSGLRRDTATLLDATGTVGDTTGTANVSIGAGITTVEPGVLVLGICHYNDDAGNITAPVSLPEGVGWLPTLLKGPGINAFSDQATVNGNDMRQTIYAGIAEAPTTIGAKTQTIVGGTNANSSGCMLSLKADETSFAPARMPLGV